MSEKLDKPTTGIPNELKLRRVTTVTAMRGEQPAVNQPTQKTVPGDDSADTP